MHASKDNNGAIDDYSGYVADGAATEDDYYYYC